jgi:hypothetical protein
MDGAAVNEPWTPKLGRWRLWPQFALRGPGFPASGVLRLAPEGLADAAAGFGPEELLSGPRWAAFEERFAEAVAEGTRELQDVAAQPAFQAAVAWQNRAVLESNIEPLLDWDPRTDGGASKMRRRAEVVAQYWQRFCVKNDSIGFFGPVGWGAWDATVKGVLVEPGEGLVKAGEVYFASWAIDALARVLDADPALHVWVPPRRVPYLRVADGAVVLPARPPQPAAPEQLAVLGLCDGCRAARDIQAELGPGVDVTAVLDDLVRRRWVTWRLDVPLGAHPDRRLRAVLERVGDTEARERALGALAVLEHGRDRVRAARDDVRELTAAMAALEADFEALTSTAAQRTKSGRTAPCRGVLYGDTTRSATVRVGTGLLDALSPMEHLFTAAAWLTSSLADRVLTRVRAVYERHSAPLDLATFWFACMPVLHGDAAADAAELQREFWSRWQEILRPEPGARRVELSGAELAERVAATFGSPAAAWTAARHLCPDVLVSAADADALSRGDVDLVLGEVHLAANTVGESLFVNQHPAPDELFAQIDEDHPGPRLLPAVAKEHRARLSTRVRYVLERPSDYSVTLVEHVADPDGARPVPSADVLVEDHGGRLVTVLPDGAVFDLVDVFAHVLTNFARDMFRVLPEADHTPRVTVDRLVVARETWRLTAAELTFADEKNEARRFVRATQWRAALGLPRFVFVVSPTEPRPFYADLDSPTYVAILAKAIRRLVRDDPRARLTISEMLPTPEQAWLTDDEGSRYTSELRFVAVDTAAESE